MPQSKSYLIIAQSARALAVSAGRGGLRVHVIDRFADQDTAALALSCQVVPADDSGFNAEKLLETLDLMRRMPLSGVIYGGGLERHYQVLDYLSRYWALFGNEAAVVKTCKEPALLFPMLARLGITHPLTTTKAPDQPPECCNWVMKLAGASGGGHIRGLHAGIQPMTHYYFQRKVPGRSLSVVFLANGAGANILGINEMWTVAPEHHDYRYHGAVTLLDLPVSVERKLGDIVQLLVRETGLRGLCGMDVILADDGDCYVLEVNPRPTATFELHQANQNLCTAHIAACNGKLIPVPHKPSLLRAHHVLYAEKDFIMPAISWPVWASDRPVPGRPLKRNDPVCVVHAKAANLADIRALLQRRTEMLRQQMGLQKIAA